MAENYSVSKAPLLLVAFASLILLTGCGKKADESRKHTPQEIEFIRDCLVVGLRPSVILELESKALAVASGQTQPARPTKNQLTDLRPSFNAAAAELNQLVTSPEAGRMAQFPQILGEIRAKQAANCSRLPDDLLHGEGVGLMILEFIKIRAQAPKQQEADRQAGERFKQDWPSLINLPNQQKVALEEILKTEQELQQVVIELAKDSEMKIVPQEAISSIVRELESRAQKAAATLTPGRFYETLIGHQFRPNAGRLEAGEMVKLLILKQKIIGHCIVSVIRLDLRGNRSGQTTSLDLSVVHQTYADGRAERLLVVLK